MNNYKNIKKIFSSYSGDGELELEFRIKYDFKNNIEVVKNIIQSNKSKKFIHTNTVNCIKSVGISNENLKYSNENLKYSNDIYQIEIKNGKNKIKNYRKSKIMKDIFENINDITYKISLSEENDIKNYIADTCDILRFKNRLTINEIIDDWKLDITLTKTLQNIVSFDIDKINNEIKIILPEYVNKNNFYEKAPWDTVDNIELEMEYSGSKNITKDNIDSCINFISNLPLNSIEDDIYKHLLVRIAKWIKPNNINRYIAGKYGLKHLAPQVISIDIINAYENLLPNIDKYYISPKIDGLRTLLLFDNEKELYYSINSTASELSLLDLGCSPHTVEGGSNDPNETILDTELYNGKYYIFDVITYKGKRVFEEEYSERIKYIDKILEDFIGCSKLIKKYVVSLDKKNWKKILKDVYEKKWDFETDGWIFTLGYSNNYINGTVWKWKSVEIISIDFLNKEENLYSGIQKKFAEKIFSEKDIPNINKNYIPIKFTPTYIPLSIISEKEINKFKIKSLKNTSLTKIVELIWDKDKWKLLKIRDDRQVDVNTGNYFGNDHRIAEITWHSIFWPLKLEHLLNSKKKYIDNLSINSDVEKNKMYFYKLYTFLLKRTKLDLSKYKLIDFGIIYPYFNFITKIGIRKLLFVICDGFSCLRIINQKYNYQFINSPEKNVLINTYKPEDINESNISLFVSNAIFISIFPTDEQIKFIEKILVKKEFLSINNKEIKIYIVAKVNGNKFYTNKNLKKENLSSIFPFDSYIGELENLFLFSLYIKK